MLGHSGADEAAGAEGMSGMSSHSLDRLLGFHVPPPPIRVRPWWFSAQELNEPLVFHLDPWLVEPIFGRDGTVLSEMEWMSQALLRVDPTDTGELVEITVFGQPGVKTRVKNIIQSLAVWFRELRDQRAKKIKRLEEFLKASSPYPETIQHPVEYKQDGNN
ncbi:oocyte-expressed protein homolog [Ictidomys tridecemlineatus]|uniref:oocyte-expressed protein homolog n=1 Tax=Ictidomys tridecemlineatus TaxID=43179 RepID=UPI00038C1659|nr:oocyte-expressed protein homolog [Ictidomys tridecemlineatus]KAG3289792.1 oocyte expressed protein [Ictidomys tridecemlineatus]